MPFPGASGARNGVTEWPAGQLEGPGMPVARLPTTPVQAPEPEESVAPPADGDEDLTLYCFCHRASFGEMIACDGVGCEVEWVSTATRKVSMTVPNLVCSIIWNVWDSSPHQPVNGCAKTVAKRRPRSAVDVEAREGQVAGALLRVTPRHKIIHHMHTVSCVRVVSYIILASVLDAFFGQHHVTVVTYRVY